jgi:hypothetical protein
VATAAAREERLPRTQGQSCPMDRTRRHRCSCLDRPAPRE